jgi:hypothetical protein
MSGNRRQRPSPSVPQSKLKIRDWKVLTPSGLRVGLHPASQMARRTAIDDSDEQMFGAE